MLRGGARLPSVPLPGRTCLLGSSTESGCIRHSCFPSAPQGPKPVGLYLAGTNSLGKKPRLLLSFDLVAAVVTVHFQLAGYRHGEA